MKIAKFLNENDLNQEIANLFKNAKKHLYLISPYIKFHDKLITILKLKKTNPNLKIIIVFGKNNTDLSKSMGFKDFQFLTEFPNIEIRYEERLHAKYYANEHVAIQTSMNLHSHSQNNNIETGILTKSNLLHKIKNKIWDEEVSFDLAASKYFNEVIKQSKPLFINEPVYKGKGLLKKYDNSKVTKDELTSFFESKNKIIHSKIEQSKVNVSTQLSSKALFSTSIIAKELGIKTIELEKTLFRKKIVDLKGNKLVLTDLGREKGGKMRDSKNGEFIVFPLKIRNEL